jgi:hypothetical protein
MTDKLYQAKQRVLAALDAHMQNVGRAMGATVTKGLYEELDKLVGKKLERYSVNPIDGDVTLYFEGGSYFYAGAANGIDWNAG